MLLLTVTSAWAQSAGSNSSAAGQSSANAAGQSSAAALAKQLSNPVANLVSVPFQVNWEFGVGPEDDTRFLVNFQPVLPFSLNERWNLIARVIVPVINQPVLVSGGEPTSGVGDILFSTFFSPAQSKGAIWGVGPVFLMPTTSDPFLGGEKWAAGPTVVVLKQSGRATCGLLANHVWSFAGEDDRSDVSQTFLQPFLAIGTKGGVTYTLNTESTANWKAASGQEWTVPINFMISKVAKLGKKPISVAAGAGYFLQKPDDGPEWKFRSVVTLLFPK
jgi:hypothetical protein